MLHKTSKSRIQFHICSTSYKLLVRIRKCRQGRWGFALASKLCIGNKIMRKHNIRGGKEMNVKCFKLSYMLSISFLLIVLSACSTTTGEDTSSKEKVEQTEEADGTKEFIFAGHNDIVSLDAGKINDEMSAIILYAVSEGLVRTSNDQIENGIAESYDISDDGLVYTFYLRDAQWADGEPVTSYDFEYSFLRTLDPETGSSQTNEFAPILNATEYASEDITDVTEVGIKAIDEKTLEITLERPEPFFLNLLAEGINFYPIREDFIEEYGEDYGSSPDKFIGNGPFVLTEWERESSLVLEKNENYWNSDNVNLDKVVELILPDENTRVSMFELGDVDAVYSVSKTQVVNYPDHGVKTGGTLQYLSFNSDAENVLNNENLRKALSYAVDKEAIVEAIASPGSEAADRMIDPTIMIDDSPIVDVYPFESEIPAAGNLELAEEYLDKALDDLGITSADELPKINYISMDSPIHKLYAEALQERWNETIGVNVEVNILPVQQAIGALIEGEYDIFLVSESTGVNPETLLKKFTVGNGNNYPNWENEEYTELIEKSASSQDMDERMDYLIEAESIILEEAAVVPVLLPGSVYLFKDYVHDLHYGRQTGSIEFIYSSVDK